MTVYKYCVICEKELNENEINMNQKHENFDFPICNDCLDKNVNEIMKVLK